MDKIINYDLISHPMNWIIVFLMVLIPFIGWQLLSQNSRFKF